MRNIILIFAVLLISLPVLASEKAADVSVVKGAVEIVHGEEVMGKRAVEGAGLIVDDILRTKRRGYAEVGLIDGTELKIFEKSRLNIKGVDRKTDGYNVAMQSGRVLFNVEKMHDVQGDFKIKTTNSILGVKGTVLGVSTGSLLTVVEVYSGQVEIFSVLAEMTEPAAVIEGGQGAVMLSSGAVATYNLAGRDVTPSLIFRNAASEAESRLGLPAGSADDALYQVIGRLESADAGVLGAAVDRLEAFDGINSTLGSMAGELGYDLGSLRESLSAGGLDEIGSLDIETVLADFETLVGAVEDLYTDPDFKSESVTELLDEQILNNYELPFGF